MMNAPNHKAADRRFCLALFGLSLAAYGWLVIQPGIFGDDPQLLFAFHRYGLDGYGDALGYSRPFGLWVYALLYPLLGDSPRLWQISAILLRTCSAWLLFMLLRQTRAQWRVPAMWAAVLCLLYPGFTQQAHALQFVLHWAALSAGLASQILMLRALDEEKAKKALLISLCALLLAGLGIFSTEYFFGLEILRPVLLWVHLQKSRAQPARGFLLRWLPYLGILSAFAFWRLGIADIPYPRPLLLEELTRDPLKALADLLARIPRDLWEAGGLAWVKAFTLQDGRLDAWVYIGLACALAAAFYILLRKDAKDDAANAGDARFFILAGLLLMLAGGVPLWISRTPLDLSFPENRTTLCLMAGACLSMAGVLRLLPARLGWAAAALLAGFSAAVQFNASLAYTQSWWELQGFFSQLTRCAPALEPGTAILYEEPFISSYPANSLAALLNWSYDPDNRSEIYSYDMLRVSERLGNELPALELDLPIRHGNFTGSTSQVLVVMLDNQGCLQILRPGSKNVAGIDPLLLQAAQISNPGRVILKTISPARPPEFMDARSQLDGCICDQP